MKLTVLEFMRQNAKFHSLMSYSLARKSFSMEPCNDETPGIYFIVNGDDILKIGKAEGRLGLKGRMQSYRSDLSTRRNDHTVERICAAMTGPLDNCVLHMYILPTPTKTMDFKGLEIELQMARSLEAVLSRRARDEGHSMQLSGQD